MLSIRTNISSLNSQRNLFSTQMSLDSSLAKLSSGYRIAKAGDDPAGNGVSANLNAEIASYSQATKNAQDGLWLVQTAEGSMNEIQSMVTRLRELAMQSASDGVSNTERVYINNEAQGLITEIDRIADTTEYNGVKALNGSQTLLTFQVGIRSTTSDQINITTTDVNANSLGTAGLQLDDMSAAAQSLTSATGASAALAIIDAALDDLSSARASNSLQGEKLNHTIATLQSTFTNVSEAYSRIKDVDVAEESSKLTRSQILLQAGVSTLAQANQVPLIALKLLG